jgi:hypothetical protein
MNRAGDRYPEVAASSASTKSARLGPNQVGADRARTVEHHGHVTWHFEEVKSESCTSRRCIAALTAAVTFALVAPAPIGAASATHQSRLGSAARCEQRPKRP